MEAINRSNAIIYFDLHGKILGVNAIFLEAMDMVRMSMRKLSENTIVFLYVKIIQGH
jgi:hypothetical protein